MSETDFWRALIIIKGASHHYSVDSLAVLTANKKLSECLRTTLRQHASTSGPRQKLQLGKTFLSQGPTSNEFSSYLHFCILALRRKDKT